MWLITRRCLKWSGDDVEAQKSRLLILVGLDLYAKGMNISVTHPQMTFTKQPTYTKKIRRILNHYKATSFMSH
jgi:hypothetical protein